MADPIIQRAFIAGELSRAAGARADLARYHTGLYQCRNCWVRREGGVQNRPGLRFLGAAHDSAGRVRILPFISEANGQTYLIEAGDNYFRFWYRDGLVLDGMSPFVLETVFAEDELDLGYAQSVDVMILTQQNHPPQQLTRGTPWSIDDAAVTPTIDPPESSALDVFGVSGTWKHRYIVTSAKEGTYEESLRSDVFESAEGTAFPTRELPVRVSITSGGEVEGAAEYYVYCDRDRNGQFGFLGTMIAIEVLPSLFLYQFNDIGLEPDFTLTPPIDKGLFAAEGDYPAVVTHYQQRRLYARSINRPETVWGSRVGQYNNFTICSPLQDSDAIEFDIASDTLMPVHHLKDMERLMVLSDDAEFLCFGDETGALTPSDVNPRKRGFAGTDYRVPPVAVGNGVIHVQGRGTRVRDLRIDGGDTSVLGGRDLTLAASHLFEGYQIVATAWQQVPNQILWAVRNDGVLLALTYAHEEEIAAWTQHTTDGVIEDVCVLPDTQAGEDVVYVVVRRDLSGGPTRCIERLDTRLVTTPADAFFVDCGLTYTGAPITVVTGLDHLEGKVVAVFADGVTVYDGDPAGGEAGTYTVSGGQITLPEAASTVHVGLPIAYAQIRTLEPDIDGSSLKDKKRIVTGVTVTVLESDPKLWAGPDEDHLRPVKREQWVASGTISGALEVTIPTRWSRDGRVVIRHTTPTPLHILAVTPQLEVE